MVFPKKLPVSPRRGILVLFIILGLRGWSQERGFSASTDMSLQLSSRPEAKLILTESLVFPFLRGSSPLTADNNIKTAFSLQITPLSLNGLGEMVWTPIAFFQLAAGGLAGSGWNMPLGHGIGINTPVDQGEGLPKKSEIHGEPFDALIWNLWTGAALQFDLAALFPGDWNHLIFRSYHEARYGSYSRASGHEPWIFENDDGENQNGLVYYGSLFLGYQMPASPLLNMAGLMAEVYIPFYNTPGGDRWGEGLPQWYLSALFNLSITSRLSTALIFQLWTRRNYGSSDLENREKIHYQEMVLDKNDPYRLVFYRAALILSYKLF